VAQQDNSNNTVITSQWQLLINYTPARVALGRTGNAIPVTEALQLKLSHAFAKDAVNTALDTNRLEQSLQPLPVLQVCSKAANRELYLQRPDLGRQLSESSSILLQSAQKNFDVALILADGLSATATQLHAPAVLKHLMPMLQKVGLTAAPIVIATQARVAIGDAIGNLLRCKVSVVLIGERPGLSVCDSMGIYSTYEPKPGLTDESRNCISNIHAAGLSYAAAAEKAFFLIQNSIALKLSGVQLKENKDSFYIE
jgi:ethanolamine ammonia-lyase small subunit